jgi:hypothetical protein
MHQLPHLHWSCCGHRCICCYRHHTDLNLSLCDLQKGTSKI